MRTVGILAGLTLTVLMLSAGLACKSEKKAETAPTPRNPGDTSGYFGALAGAREFAESGACLMNLSNIGKTLAIYAAANGNFPPSFKELSTIGQIPTKCPDPPNPDYVYVPGLTPNSPSDAIIVYDPEPHNGKINILHVNGSAESIPKEQFKKP